VAQHKSHNEDLQRQRTATRLAKVVGHKHPVYLVPVCPFLKLHLELAAEVVRLLAMGGPLLEWQGFYLTTVCEEVIATLRT
jgi:hypothetical protein